MHERISLTLPQLYIFHTSQMYSVGCNAVVKSEEFINSQDQRLKVLSDYQILDTSHEKIFDDITDLIADILSAPIAVVSFIDENRTWFKSYKGLSTCEAPQQWSFCYQGLEKDDQFIVEDTLEDSRFKNNPLVTGNPNIRFYASALLITPQGTKIGALAIMDTVPRKISPAQLKVLKNFADMIIQNLELRKIRLNQERTQKFIELQEYHFENLRVLIVDDSVENQNLFVAYLKKYGAKIELAENGAVALELLKSKEFDIVLMDIQMPIMDGITAMKEFREWEKATSHTKTPIIAITAGATEKVKMLSLLAGCDVFLAKPVKKDMILDTIKKLSN